jgi:hypothetical protein
MGIEVRLKAESGEVLAEVNDRQIALYRATSGPLTGTRLLRYLLPHGDAVFNQAQADDLRNDVHALLRAHSGTPLSAVLAEIEPLIRAPRTICRLCSMWLTIQNWGSATLSTSRCRKSWRLASFTAQAAVPPSAFGCAATTSTTFG